MRIGPLLGLAGLAAFIYFCFTRERDAAGEFSAPQRESDARPGDGSRSAAAPRSGPRFHAGDPTVRH